MPFIQHNTWTRMNQVVNSYYLNHPELIENMLRKVGAQNIRSMNGEIRCTCPLHKGDGQNFVVWYDRGMITWSCLSHHCGKGPLSLLVQKKYNATFEQAVASLARLAGLQINGDYIKVTASTMQEESLADLQRRLGLSSQKQANQPTYFPETWVEFSLRQTHHYFLRRQFSSTVLQKFQVGFVPANTWLIPDPTPENPQHTKGWKQDRISIPWRDREGRCIGFAGRRVDGVDYLKYQTFPGTKRAFALYGLHEKMCQQAIQQTRVLHVVEGYSDVWRGWMHQCYNVVCPGGTDFAPEQLDIIRTLDLDHVVLFMDGDEPGQLASNRMANQLFKLTRVLVAYSPLGRDPGDLLAYRDFWTPIVQAKQYCPRR